MMLAEMRETRENQEHSLNQRHYASAIGYEMEKNYIRCYMYNDSKKKIH